MVCKKCGTIHNAGVQYCTNCGATLDAPAVEKETVVVVQQDTSKNIPEMYRPLGAWAYFGYQLLFALPIVGFICLIVFSCDSSNLNRRNFARSYWCSLLISVIIIVFLVLILIGTGFSIEALLNLT